MKYGVAEYPHCFRRQVYLCETTAFGLTSNVSYFQYMESARFELMKELCLFDPSNVLSCNYILAHAECDYKDVSRYDDYLVIYSRISEVQASSFVIEDVILNEKTGRLVATGKVSLVSYNHKEGRTVPLSQKVRKALKSCV